MRSLLGKVIVNKLGGELCLLLHQQPTIFRIIILIRLFFDKHFSSRYALVYRAYFMKQNNLFKTYFLKKFINSKLPNRSKPQIFLCDLYKMTLFFAFSSSYSKKVHIIIRSSREKVRQKEAQIRDVNCPHVFFFRLLLLFCFCS